MGIKNLHSFLKNTCPNIYKKKHLSEYCQQKITVDVSIYLCKYKSVYGTKWLEAIFKLICIMRKYNIHLFFIYDAKAPPEKDKVRLQRKEAREKNKQRIDRIEEIWNEHLKKVCNQDEDIETKIFFPQHFDYDILMERFIKRCSIQCNNDSGLKKQEIQKEIERLHNTVISISLQDILLTKELCKLCKIPFMTAYGEAEATCSSLDRQNYVEGVLTEDTDVLAYGANKMLFRLDILEETLLEINIQDIYRELELNPLEFLDFCILCGTDYNSNIHRVGTETSFKLIKKWRTLEKIQVECAHLPVSDLNYKRVRELFLTFLSFHSIDIPFCGIPHFPSLFEFGFSNNISIPSQDEIKDIFIHSCFSFIDKQEKCSFSSCHVEDEQKKETTNSSLPSLLSLPSNQVEQQNNHLKNTNKTLLLLHSKLSCM